MALPSSRMAPVVAGFSPDITSNSVVLPAPLGPPMPRISPAPTSKDRSRTAASAPKDLPTCLHDSNGVAAASAVIRLCLDPRRHHELGCAVRRRRDQAGTLGVVLDLQELMRHAE